MEKVPFSKYTKELRLEAVRLVSEGGLSAGEAATRLSLPKSTLENWVRAFKAGKLENIGSTHRPLTEVEIELSRVKQDLALMRMERDILKKRPCTLPRSRCTARGDEANATRLFAGGACRVLRVSAGGFHAGRTRGPSRRAQEGGRLEIEIRAAHQRTRETYGPERLQQDLGCSRGAHRGAYDLCSHRRGLALPGRAQGFVHPQDRRPRHGRAHDLQPGDRVAAAGCGDHRTLYRSASSLG